MKPVERIPNIWDKLKYFTRNERWGDVDRIDHELLMRLDQWRGFIKTPVFISFGTRGAHSKKSQHYLGRAVDVVCPVYTGDLFDLYLSAERYGFRGIGLYRHWKYEDKVTGGLHLDTRIYEDDPDHLRHGRWLGIVLNGKQVYTALTLKNLRTFNFL